MEFDQSIQTRWRVALVLSVFAAASPILLRVYVLAIEPRDAPWTVFLLSPLWVLVFCSSWLFAVFSILAKEGNARWAWFAIALSVCTVVGTAAWVKSVEQ